MEANPRREGLHFSLTMYQNQGYPAIESQRDFYRIRQAQRSLAAGAPGFTERGASGI